MKLLLLILAATCAFAQAIGAPWKDTTADIAATNLTDPLDAKLNFQACTGNPNGQLAGTAGKDTAWCSSVYYLATVTGSTTTAVWTPIPFVGMVYPGAGIGVSTGSAWGTSLGVQTTVGSPGLDTNIATEKAIRTALPVASGSNPVMDGAAAPGVAASYSRSDHVHPSDITKAASNASTVVNGQTCALGSTCSLAVNNLTAGAVPAGSTIAIPQWAEFHAGVCQGSTASLSFNLPSSPPTAACKTGTNTQFAVAQFTASGQTVQGSFILPDDWTSVLAVEYRFLSETAASTGNVVWDFSYACVANPGASHDPSWAANQTATVAAGANNLSNMTTLSTPTISGCSAGQRMFYRLQLDASTTAAGNQDLVAVRFKIKRTVTAL